MKLKAEGTLLELLKTSGFDKEDIEAVESAFSLQAKKQIEEQRQAEKSNQSESKIEMARRLRRIK